MCKNRFQPCGMSTKYCQQQIIDVAAEKAIKKLKKKMKG